MRKHIVKRIEPCFIPSFVHVCSGKDFTVSRENGTSDNHFLLTLLLCIIDMRINFIRFFQIKMYQIPG